jgi:hypothetical protein
MHRNLLPLILLPALVACGDIVVEKPTPPTNLSALQRSYDEPSAPVNATTALEAFENYGAFGEIVGEAGLHDFIEDLLDGTAEGIGEDDDEEQDGALRVREEGLSFGGNGYAEIERICDGWDTAADPGRMNATLTFSPDDDNVVKIDPIIWGAFHDCRYTASESGERIFLPESTSINVHHGGALSFENGFGEGTVLLELVGGFDLGDRTIEPDIDFRFGIGDGDFQYKLETSQGDLVAQGSVTRPESLRGSNGTFTCDITEGTCTNVDTGDSFSLR